MALVSRGHSVIEARDAPSAASAATAADALHLVVLDLNMPGGTVADTLHTVREYHPDLPVLVLSGELELPHELASAGVTFARKPVELDVFLNCVARLLAESSSPLAAPIEI